MSATEQSTGGVGRLSLTTTTVIMVAAVIAFFLLFVLAFFLFLRAKRYWGAIPVSSGIRARLATSAAAPEPLPRGLDASAVAALPSMLVRAGGLKEGLECAVCLCELSEGDAARLLPKCGHAFHLQCIDLWFCSHSTCPLCRSSVELDSPERAVSGAESAPGNSRSMESLPDSAAGVLLCASQDQVTDGSSSSPEATSSTSGSSCERSEDALVIEVPRRAVDGFRSRSSPLPVSRLPEEENRSPTAPKLTSLRRLLILGSRMAGASCSTRGCDIEQGCPPVPKTPASS